MPQRIRLGEFTVQKYSAQWASRASPSTPRLSGPTSSANLHQWNSAAPAGARADSQGGQRLKKSRIEAVPRPNRVGVQERLSRWERVAALRRAINDTREDLSRWSSLIWALPQCFRMIYTVSILASACGTALSRSVTSDFLVDKTDTRGQ
ncbi:hypothetical protein BJY01DRAFT_215830 [Aspergillus pseudoustus]|uniref:Uncharacterized protein n=1 Tax=Aspergillus pseudoustus TaxID=1810923 RepID=A0ABR4JTL3_9EURO